MKTRKRLSNVDIVWRTRVRCLSCHTIQLDEMFQSPRYKSRKYYVGCCVCDHPYAMYER